MRESFKCRWPPRLRKAMDAEMAYLDAFDCRFNYHRPHGALAGRPSQPRISNLSAAVIQSRLTCATPLTIYVKPLLIRRTAAELFPSLFIGGGGPPTTGRRRRVSAAASELIGNQKALFRIEIVSLDFTARSTLYLVLLSASTSLSCRSTVRVVFFTLFKMAFIKKSHKQLSICKT